MEDLQSPRLEALSAHIERLKTALEGPEAVASLEPVRRITRSLARAADDLALPEVARRAREARARPTEELVDAARALLDFLVALGPARAAVDAHVLVVEDDPTMATALVACLEHEDRVVHLAGTAAQAEQLLAAHPIDLVLLDLILPDRDGRDLLLQLREDPTTAGLPVIVLTGYAGAVTRAECLAVGARAFLEKPIDAELLRQAVTPLLGERDREADARLDPTTGILSRAGLTEAYRTLRSRTGKVEGPLAVAILSVEPFQQVLRRLGREGAADLLKAVAQHMSASLGPRDELGRWSGAELLALLPGTSSADAKDRMEEGLSHLAASGILDRQLEAGIALSFAGGVTVADSGADLREAAFAAEQSMQPAWRDGRRVTFAPAPAGSSAPPRVLLVEDDRVTATLIQHRLVREGFDVIDFLNGEDAFRWASTAPVDMAILDVNVPGMGGLEILERLRGIPRLREIPIIVLTGLGREADVVRGLELGADDYVLKPFSPAELLARVRRRAAGARNRAPDSAVGRGAPSQTSST